MGLFSSKKKYFAYAGSSSLFEGSPNTLDSTILTTMIEGGGMADAVTWTINTDTFARSKSMMRYAERGADPAREGGYIRGFPTSNMDLVVVDPAAVELALTVSEGAYDALVTWRGGNYSERFVLNYLVQQNYNNSDYFAWGVAPDDTHWEADRETIQIPVIDPSTGVYYVIDNDPDFVKQSAELAGDSLLDVYGPDGLAQLALDPRYDGTYKVTWSYVDSAGNPATYTTDTLFDFSPYLTPQLIMASYLKGADTHYWIYEIDSGVDPVFEAAIDVENKEEEYLPVAVLMQDKIWFDADPDSELAITTNKLIKRLATSGTKIREAFEEAEAENTEEQQGDKWDFFVHFATPINTNVRGSKEYLWYFFNEMQDWQTTTWGDYYDYLATQTVSSYTTAQPVSELNITEASINGYNVAYRWSFIHTKDFAGSYTIDDPLATGGTRPLNAKEIDIDIFERTDDTEFPQDPGYQEAIDDIFGPGTIVGLDSDDDEITGYHDFVIITRQNPEDPDNPGVPQGYVRMLIMGLSMEYKINTLEDSGDYQFRYAQPKLFGTEEETKEFRIPMLYKSLKEVPTLHREEAVADALTATVFLVLVVKVAWYQTGFFAWLIIIIAVVIIIYAFYNPQAIQAATAAIATAIGTTSAIVIWTIHVILSFAVGWIISTAGQNIGGTAGTVFTIIAAVAMSYSQGGYRGLGDTFQDFMNSPGWATASSFINSVMPIYDMGYAVYSSSVLNKLENDMEDFTRSSREKQMALEDAWDSFGPVPSWLDPMDLVAVFKRMGGSELADSYYNRTLQANPGILGYDLISNFAEAAIALPQEPGQPSIIDGMFADFARQRGVV